MKSIHYLLIPVFGFYSFVANAQTNWSDTGPYWEPKLPELILSLQNELLNCNKDTFNHKVCFSKILQGARVSRENSIVLNISFEDEKLFNNAKEVFEQQAIEKKAIVSKHHDYARFDAKEYALIIPSNGQKTLTIYFKDCLSLFSTKQAIKKDPINTRVSISGLTPGITTEKEIKRIIESKGFRTFKKHYLTPPDFQSDSSFLYWYSSLYEIEGSFFGLLGEINSTITFGDNKIVDRIDINCKWDLQFFDKLSKELSNKYVAQKSTLDDYSIRFYPKSPLCKKYLCPSVKLSKDGDFLNISLDGSQSYIGQGNYFYRWHAERAKIIEKSVDLFK